MHEAAEAPNVAAETVVLALQHLRRNEAVRAYHVRELLSKALQLDGDAKVRNVGLRIWSCRVHQDIERFDISMNDIFAVMFLEAARHLFNYSLCYRFYVVVRP